MTENITTYFDGGRLLWRGEIAVNGGAPRVVEFDLSETDWDLADAEAVGVLVHNAIGEAIGTQNSLSSMQRDPLA